MQITETTTAEGSGFWGDGVYEIELNTRLTTYTDSSGNNARTIHRHDLKFSRDSKSDHRVFDSESKRAKFIEKHFTQLEIREIPKDEQISRSLPDPLEQIVGEYLSDVTFVMDYLQMGFCGSSFNFYTWPVVVLATGNVDITQAGYRDALCGLIAKTVREVDVYLDTGITFKFQSGEIMTVSLRVPVGSKLQEVATYSTRKRLGIIWSAGEEPFE